MQSPEFGRHSLLQSFVKIIILIWARFEESCQSAVAIGAALWHVCGVVPWVSCVLWVLSMFVALISFMSTSSPGWQIYGFSHWILNNHMEKLYILQHVHT